LVLSSDGQLFSIFQAQRFFINFTDKDFVDNVRAMNLYKGILA